MSDAPSGVYSGRLSFDPDTLFHTDPDGNPVVTEDGGKTWRYATESDPSHFDRYHQNFVAIDSTANKLAELQMEHGREKAEELMREQHPHHYEVQPDDPHFAGVRSESDVKSPKLTGHTDAWSDQ